MPGAYEIGRTIKALGQRLSASEFRLLPLHSELGSREQDAALDASDRRKIIVSTNVAETSLTIDDVRLVVDSGQARVARYDPARGLNTLWIEKISHASALQRTGRAGRTGPQMHYFGQSESIARDRNSTSQKFTGWIFPSRF